MKRMGPLSGIRVVEVAGLGAGPFACMVLADLGADVIRVDRLSHGGPAADPMGRGRKSIAVDLKTADGIEVLLRLITSADILVEAFRPGVAERLGFGPRECQDRNPGLVYARMTGWGQDGPLASTAGHDIDYIAVAGALHLTGPAGHRPVPPLNLVGDFGGGGMLLVVGVLAALLERQRSGRGQIVDAAMVDGAALLTTMVHSMLSAGLWPGGRGENLLDSGAPFYDTYQTADGKFMAVGALEPQFYAELIARLGLQAADLPDRMDRTAWPALRDRFATEFALRSQAEWIDIFAGSDACVAPVLSPAEAPSHPQNLARSTFAEVGGVTQPGPAPRFSRTPAGLPSPPPATGADTDAVLTDAGYSPEEIAALRESGAVG